MSAANIQNTSHSTINSAFVESLESCRREAGCPLQQALVCPHRAGDQPWAQAGTFAQPSGPAGRRPVPGRSSGGGPRPPAPSRP